MLTLTQQAVCVLSLMFCPSEAEITLLLTLRLGVCLESFGYLVVSYIEIF